MILLGKTQMKKLIVIVAVIALLISMMPAVALAGVDGDYLYFEVGGSTVEIAGYVGAATVITIPDTLNGMQVVGIRSSAFSGTGLTSVTVPEGVTRISSGAFSSCTKLTSISLPLTLQTIENGAFASCSSLASITLPSGLQSIGTNVFQDCSLLRSVTLPNTLNFIGPNAFYGCDELNSVTIPASMTTIGANAFYGSGLVSIDIPATVQSIGDSAFATASSLRIVTLHEGLLTIGTGAFAATGLTTVTIPSTVTSVDAYAFSSCSSLAKATVLGASSSCSLGYPTFTHPMAVGIFGFAGSTAQTYSSFYGLTFTTIYKVSFDSKGGTAVNFGYNVLGGTVSKPADPTRSGSVFAGWYDNDDFIGSAVTFPYEVTGTQTLYAEWTPVYTVTFDSNGGSAIASQDIVEGGNVTKPADPTRSGFVFAGWYDNDDFVGSAVTFPYEVTGTQTLYAKWTPVYTVTFDSNGGSAIPSQDILEGGKVTRPADPTRSGFVFAGWYDNDDFIGSAVTFPYEVTGTQTLYAKWTPIYYRDVRLQRRQRDPFAGYRGGR